MYTSHLPHSPIWFYFIIFYVFCFGISLIFFYYFFFSWNVSNCWCIKRNSYRMEHTYGYNIPTAMAMTMATAMVMSMKYNTGMNWWCICLDFINQNRISLTVYMIHICKHNFIAFSNIFSHNFDGVYEKKEEERDRECGNEYVVVFYGFCVKNWLLRFQSNIFRNVFWIFFDRPIHTQFANGVRLTSDDIDSSLIRKKKILSISTHSQSL